MTIKKTFFKKITKDALFRQEEAAANPQQETRTSAFEVRVEEDSGTCKTATFFFFFAPSRKVPLHTVCCGTTGLPRIGAADLTESAMEKRGWRRPTKGERQTIQSEL